MPIPSTSIAQQLKVEFSKLAGFGRDIVDATSQVFRYNRFALLALASVVTGILWVAGCSPVTVFVLALLCLAVPPLLIALFAYAFIGLLFSVY